MNIILLIINGALWGASAMFYKIGIQTTEGSVMGFIRLFTAGVFLYIVCKVKNKKVFIYKNISKNIFIGCINFAIPMILFAIASEHLDSGTLSMLNVMTVIFIVLLSFFVLKNKIYINEIIGIVFSIFGIYLIFSQSRLSFNQSHLYSIISVLFATLCYAIGGIFIKKYCKNIDPLSNVTASIIFASLLLMPYFLYSVDYKIFYNMNFTLSMLFLGFGCTAIANVIYFYLIQSSSVEFASTTTLLIPIFGMAYGTIFLNESLTWNKLFGGLMILIGIKLINNLKNNLKFKSLFSVK